MTATIYLIPAEGLTVRDPATKEPLPRGGARKPRSRYWLRRVAERSCTVGEPKPKKTTPKKAD